MATATTFIKLDRNILRWRWYTNPNTARVFLHLLITANVSDKPFENITVKRGETVTTYEKLSSALNLSVQQVRTAVKHLKSTGEITTCQYSKYQVITVVNYNEYQGNQQDNQQPINSHLTVNQQQLKNNKNNKNNKYNTRVRARANSSFDVDEFFRIAVNHTRETMSHAMHKEH